jgi:acetoin utilization protein AcuB
MDVHSGDATNQEARMRVGDLMTHNPIAADYATPVGEVRRTMETNGIRHMPVVEEGKVVGLLSTRDLSFVDGILDLFADLDDMFAQPVMDLPVKKLWSMDLLPKRAVITATAGMAITDAIDLLVDHQISALPVIDPDNGSLIGILSYVDILRWVRREQG